MSERRDKQGKSVAEPGAGKLRPYRRKLEEKLFELELTRSQDSGDLGLYDAPEPGGALALFAQRAALQEST